MKTFRKIISIFAVIAILATSLSIISFADGGYEPTFTSGNFIYKNCHFDDGIEVVGYTDSSAKTISIPKQLDGHTVVGIGRHYEPKEGEYAFGSLKNLTSVSIPDSVTIIDNETFYGCAGLTSITIPNSVTNIFSSAFNGCTSLTSITIPNSVKKIDDWAFAGCTKLTSITVSDSVTDISYSAFNETGYYNNEANWKDDVLYIGNILLQAKSTITGTYSIKSGTKVIAGDAFGNCKSLTGITIPDSVVSIGYSAFWYCKNLASVIIPNGVTCINNDTFRGCSGLTSVTIPNSVTDIGYDAFRYCESLESITIPNSVKSIGRYAFEECYSLTSLTIPNSVTSIGEYAFASCTGLNSVTIPSSIENIAPWAFYKCSGLTSIVIENGVTSISSGAFGYCSSLTSVTIPDSVTSIGENAFLWCESIENVKIGTGLETIESGAFSRCESLEGFTVDKNNKYFSNDQCGVLFNKDKTELIAFPCGVCMDYTIPNSVKRLMEGAFKTSKITKITIPNSITNISESAFMYCDNLTSVVIPNSVTDIGRWAFDGCENLISITIPNSVTSVGYNAFEDTGYYNNEANWQNGVLYIGNHLIKADEVSGSYSVKSGTITIATDAFEYCDNLTGITLPDGLLNINESAFYGCESLTKITIPDSVKTIGESAFSYTEYYNNEANWQNGVLYIGNYLIDADDVSDSYSVKAGIKTIADSAFAFCDELTSITLPDSIKIIGDSAFCYCKNIKDVYYSGTSEQWNKISICEGNECLTDANIHFAGSPQGHTHSYTSVVVKPTCTEQGYTEYTCSSCHYSYKDNYVKPVGHVWSNWTRTTEPTIDAEGIETRECSACHTKETRKIEKLQVLVDNATGVKIGFEDEFEAGTDIKVTEVFDGQSLQVISNNFGDVKTKIFDITPEKDGVKVQPNGKVTIRIPIPDGFNANKIFVVYVDSVSGKTTTLPTKVVGNYIEFETDHFSQYALVEGKGQVKSVSLNKLELQYKSSAKLNPVIEVDNGVKYKVEYKSSNTNVVTVDNNGNIYGAKKGNATITCIVTDEYGNTVQNTCNVNVKYVWWQWIIKIVLFGWIWY